MRISGNTALQRAVPTANAIIIDDRTHLLFYGKIAMLARSHTDHGPGQADMNTGINLSHDVRMLISLETCGG